LGRITIVSDRRLGLILLLAMLLLSLTSCGPRTLPPQAYQDLVIETLQGGELEEGVPPFPGLISSIKSLFESLYCAESNCVFPSEMDYAAGIAERKLVDIYEYKARICNPKKFRPPEELQPDHEQICDILKRIRINVDAIKITAQMAARSLAQSSHDSSALERIAESHSAQIMGHKVEIIGALRQLQEIAWLAPVFEGVEAEIPELLTETEQEPGRSRLPVSAFPKSVL
jgi:hypothetical protein